MIRIVVAALAGYVVGGKAFDRYRPPPACASGWTSETSYLFDCAPGAQLTDEQIARRSHERLAAQAAAAAAIYLAWGRFA